MNRIVLAVMVALLSAAGMSTWLAVTANQEIGRLEQQNETLKASYEWISGERNTLDQLYADQKTEVSRVRINLENQLEALRNAKADACADAAVTADRIGILQTPVWLDQTGELPGGTGGVYTADPLPGAAEDGDKKSGD